MTYVVCTKCKNGRATIQGDTLICPNGHKFKLVENPEDCVTNELCKARMETMYAWLKGTFATTVVTLALIIIQLVKGFG